MPLCGDKYCPSRRQRGFTLMEVMLSLVIFLMMTLVFAAAFPLVTSEAHAGNNNDQAAMLAQHKLDQLRAAGFTVLQSPDSNSSSGSLQSLGIIDPGSLSGDSMPYTATFTQVDNLAQTNGPGSGYYPAGASGTISVQDVRSVNPNLSADPGSICLVTVTIQWPGGPVIGGSYSTSTLIAQNGGE